MRGTATTNSNTAYFRSPGGFTDSLYRYSINHDEWGQPSQPPCKYYGLVYIEGQLTTVGGEKLRWFGLSKVTGQLFSLQDGEWKERHPPLNTARSSPAVVSTCYNGHDYIIVAGGKGGGGDWITSVEVLLNGKWHHKADLPVPLQSPLATVSNTICYVISATYIIGYSISLRDLLVDSRPIESQNPPLPWTQLPHLPLLYATPVSMCGEFFIVGGRGRNDSGIRSSAIYQLWNNQFMEIGHMSEAKWACLVVTPSPDKMVVVGGLGSNAITHTVEELSVV